MESAIRYLFFAFTESWERRLKPGLMIIYVGTAGRMQVVTGMVECKGLAVHRFRWSVHRLQWSV